ncbi:MAG: hypothetical protein Q4C06_05960, partial [Bacillota bacterium]|nr:hypothetical protein [Bacillota bacterium]
MSFLNRLFAAEKNNSVPVPSIAFLDTGLSPVADFTEPKNRILAFLDLVNGKKEPYDDNGHGTHVTVSSKHKKRPLLRGVSLMTVRTIS